MCRGERAYKSSWYSGALTKTSWSTVLATIYSFLLQVVATKALGYSSFFSGGLAVKTKASSWNFQLNHPPAKKLGSLPGDVRSNQTQSDLADVKVLNDRRSTRQLRETTSRDQAFLQKVLGLCPVRLYVGMSTHGAFNSAT